MEEEKIEANKKIQMALLKANFELPEEDVNWLNQFDPDVLEEIRISLKDSMSLEDVKEKFKPDMNVIDAKQIRMEIYQQTQLNVILNRISGLESMIGIQLEDNDSLTAWIKEIDEKITVLGTKVDEERKSHSHLPAKNPDLIYADSQEEKQKLKKGLFKKKDRDGALMRMVESGRFTPEQLEEITEAINQNLDPDIILKIAKPHLTPAAMHQMRLFYIARCKNQEQTQSVNETAENQEDDPVSYDDYEDESEDYGY